MYESVYWSIWAQNLKCRGLNEPAAFLIESLGPLAVFLAQTAYLGQPFLKGVLPEEQWTPLIDMLEDQSKRTAFTALLEEDKD